MSICQHHQLKRELSQWIEHARSASQQLQNVRLCAECGHYLSLLGDGRGDIVEEVWASPSHQRKQAQAPLADQLAALRQEQAPRPEIQRIRRNSNDELYQRLPKLRSVLFDYLFD